jgi:hypothetical protein
MRAVLSLAVLVVVPAYAALPTLACDLDQASTHFVVYVNGAKQADKPAPCRFDVGGLGTGRYRFTVAGVRFVGGVRQESAKSQTYCAHAINSTKAREWAHSPCLRCTPYNNATSCVNE